MRIKRDHVNYAPFLALAQDGYAVLLPTMSRTPYLAWQLPDGRAIIGGTTQDRGVWNAGGRVDDGHMSRAQESNHIWPSIADFIETAEIEGREAALRAAMWLDPGKYIEYNDGLSIFRSAGDALYRPRLWTDTTLHWLDTEYWEPSIGFASYDEAWLYGVAVKNRFTATQPRQLLPGAVVPELGVKNYHAHIGTLTIRMASDFFNRAPSFYRYWMTNRGGTVETGIEAPGPQTLKLSDMLPAFQWGEFDNGNPKSVEAALSEGTLFYVRRMDGERGSGLVGWWSGGGRTAN